MPLSHKPTESKILLEIEIYSLTRAELLCLLCYEIPCINGDLSKPFYATGLGPLTKNLDVSTFSSYGIKEYPGIFQYLIQLTERPFIKI